MKLNRTWTLALIGGLALYALFVLGFILNGTLGEHGATDFNPYWYGGHFLQEGQDPYQAYFLGESLPVRHPDLEPIPSNTPPMMLLLYPFSYLPWTVAKILWMVCNFAFIFLSFRLVLFNLPIPGFPLDRLTQILIALIFFDLSATRIAIENGQVTILVFLLIISALVLADRAWLLAGFLLGIGLSKYSVALPIFLFLLYRQKYGILGAAILTQFLGTVILSLLTGNPITAIISENIRIFFLVYNQPGVQLATLFKGTPLGLPATIVMTVTVFGLLYAWLGRHKHTKDLQDIVNYHVLNILIFWALLVAYHRPYDVIMIILFMSLAFRGLYHQELWQLSPTQGRLLAAELGVTMVLLIIPPRIVDMILPGTYNLLTNVVPAFLLLVLLVITMFLLHQVLGRDQLSSQLQVQQSQRAADNSGYD
jgi:Glycosyltransferase family 87